MKAKPLTRAIHSTIAGTAISLIPLASVQASTTMYNLYNAFSSPTATDGDVKVDGFLWGEEADSPGNPNAAIPGWVGTIRPTTTPFSTTTGMALNWAAHITRTGDSLVISQADAFARYGVYPDIDTSSGAWRDPSMPRAAGTRYSIDIGLFKSDVTQTVNLNLSGIINPDANLGMTIYQGVSQSSFFSHYGYPVFDSPTDYFDYSEVTSTTIGNTTTTTQTDYFLPYVTRTALDPDTHLTANSLSFQAEAGQLYTIMLGGNNGKIYDGYDGYRLSITTVPLPSALWLFVTALSGMLGLQQHKRLRR